MTNVAVVAHRDKRLGGGLGELRQILDRAGVTHPAWFEVSKSKQAPKQVRRALHDGADLLFVWGGDGMVQRCVDAAVGSGAVIAILPAGTANLLATNLGITRDLEQCVDTGLHGADRTIDVGLMNGEHFGVMAGAGFDALMIASVDGRAKDRLGRAAYVLGGAKNLRLRGFRARIKIDGDEWFDGRASCVLVANVAKVFGGVTVFPEAEPDDGLLDLAVVTAEGIWQWTRTLARTVTGDPERSKFVQTTRGRRLDVRLGRKMPYQLDGGVRNATKRLRIEVQPRAIRIRVPEETGSR